MSTVSIRDVARVAGVSTATVSNVLNESRPVTEATRQRVLAAVERLGYRPNVMARSLQAQRSFLIGYSWPDAPPDQGSPVLDRFIHSMGRAAYEAGYHLLAFPSERDELTVYHDLVKTNRVDGIVLSAVDIDDARVSYLAATAMPFVSFGRASDQDDPPIAWVDVDGQAGVRRAVQHLAAQGYERIGMLAWPRGSRSGEDRLAGYRAGLVEIGQPFDERLVVRVKHDSADAARGARRLLALPEAARPDAFVCVSDLVAVGAIHAVRDAGLRVGPDVGIVGFDDVPMAELLTPPLTTLHQPVDEIGTVIIRQLTALINGETLPPEAAHILLEPELVIRASSRRSA